jgi:hypothetical protein
MESEIVLDSLLSQIEKQSLKHLGRKGLRDSMFSALQQIIVTGNALVFYPPGEKNIVVYTMRDYVVERDTFSNVIEILIEDKRVFKSLSDDVKQLLSDGKSYKDDDVVAYYIWIKKVGDRFELDQYVEDILLTNKETKGIYPEDSLPYIPIVWRLARGHNYGTSLVEEYAGDFKALEVLTTAFVKGLAIAADYKQLVDPTGLTDIDDLVDSDFGAYISGRADDISIPQATKAADFQALQQGLDVFTRRIARAFLLSGMVVRDAERVTAFEVQQQINELETALGGVYTRLASSLQQPLATLVLKEVDKELSPKNGVKPVIITGIDAVSRFNDMNAVQMWLSDLALLAQLPEQAQMSLNTEALASYMASSRGVDAQKFVKTKEQVQAEMQAMQQQQVAQQGQMAMQESVANNVGQ